MGSREDVFNTVLAGVLDKTRRNWQAWGQPTGMLKSGLQPDIITQENGASPVILETEFHPASTLETDMRNKLNQTDTQGRDVTAVIGVKTPARFKPLNQTGIENELKQAVDLEYAILMPERFPAQDWLTGTAFDIARVAQALSMSNAKINDSVDVMESTIDAVAHLIDQSGSDTKAKIATLLYQVENMQTWKMAGLILTNAFIFQSRIAGDRGIQNFMELQVVGIVPLNGLIKSWNHILETNYYPIFQVAKNILEHISEEAAEQIIDKLVQTTSRIGRMGLLQSTDMYGSLIQRMISDRKALASFYTMSESAALLASIVTPPISADVYKNEKSMLSVRCADFACGAGTLLTSLYRNLIQNYEINGGNMEMIHDKMMEKCMYGADVLPSATHLTASSLANFFPKKLFEQTNVKVAWFGMKAKVCHLGSLNLILDKITFDKKGETIRGKGTDAYYNPDIPNDFFDVIVMNPPFTGNTREGGKEGYAMFKSLDTTKNMQKQMASISKKIFKDTCANGNAGYATNFMAIADKKLKPGGVMGLILPSTIHYGSSWSKVRDLLALRYEDTTMISIASPTNKSTAFSADTDMNEVMLIANKSDSNRLNKIKNAELRIVELNKDIKKVKNTKIKTRINIVDSQKMRKQQVEFLESIKKAKRGKFVSLYSRPNSALQASEFGKIITRQSDSLTLERHSSGGSVLTLGNQPFGTVLNCPMDTPWWFVGVFDPTLVQCAYALRNGSLKLPVGHTTFDIPMTLLGDNLGLSTRDIGDYVKTSSGKDGNPRSPFFITPLGGQVRATRYALWNNDNESQTSMLVKPDCMATEKKHATREHVDRVAGTATRVHINRLAWFTTQCLSVFYTEEKSLGGESLPNVIMAEKYEKAFAAWSNSTLGILCFWASSGRQQLGRNVYSRTSLQSMPVLDFAKLRSVQLDKLSKTFDTYKSEPLLAIKNMYKDDTRIAIDGAVSDVLGIGEPLDDLRIRLSMEPSINDGKADSELLKR